MDWTDLMERERLEERSCRCWYWCYSSCGKIVVVLLAYLTCCCCCCCWRQQHQPSCWCSRANNCRRTDYSLIVHVLVGVCLSTLGHWVELEGVLITAGVVCSLITLAQPLSPTAHPLTQSTVACSLVRPLQKMLLLLPSAPLTNAHPLTAASSQHWPVAAMAGCMLPCTCSHQKSTTSTTITTTRWKSPSRQRQRDEGSGSGNVRATATALASFVIGSACSGNACFFGHKLLWVQHQAQARNSTLPFSLTTMYQIRTVPLYCTSMLHRGWWKSFWRRLSTGAFCQNLFLGFDERVDRCFKAALNTR